jgi:hypothetical protein
VQENIMTILTAPLTHPISNKALWIGRALSGLAIAALAMDTAMKLLRVPEAVQGTTELGYPAHAVLTIGLLQLACVLLYALPRTAVLGAILLTGYFGGAVATHVRLDNPLLSHVLSGVYVACFVCGGLYLREPRLRALLPFRR